MSFSFWKEMFNYNSKIDRPVFWKNSLIWGMITFVIYYFVSFMMGVFSELAESPPEPFYALSMLLGFFLGMAYLFSLFSSIVRRLRDTRFSVYWSILFFVPIFSLVLIAPLLFPSQTEEEIKRKKAY